MEKCVAVFAAVNFAIIGLSHICQQQAWREFFLALHAMGRPGAFANGLLTLITGSIIVAFHNVWSGPAVVLTLIGWAYILKSTVIFLHPDGNLRSMASVQTAPRWKLHTAGILLLAVSTLLLLCVLGGVYADGTSTDS
ncbi:MAG: hypothetical protein NXI04_16230 [Planctomycetaceae bacterium]|nr:hypothetical protein [Planctomycetaceae bacterium]